MTVDVMLFHTKLFMTAIISLGVGAFHIIKPH
jgi:hypothetical protein